MAYKKLASFAQKAFAPPQPGTFPPPLPLSLPGLLNTQPRSRLMYEQQGRKDNVEATEQLDSVQTAPLQPAPPEDLDLIFREHHSTVFRAAYRVTGNASDAEDVLQTVFMRLLRRPPEAEAVGNMEGYLRRAAVNATLDL